MSAILFAINYMRSLMRREEGQDLVEYGLLVVLIAVVVAVAVGLFGGEVRTFFEGLWTSISNEANT